jgi:predicted GH43/DUF377 family glycosyl hydrolase
MTRPTVDDRDVILFPEKIAGQYVMLHRPDRWREPSHATNAPGIRIAFSDDPLWWEESALLATPQQPWESLKIGGNAPPIRTERGWLVLYHGVDEDIVYRVGALLLDLDDPTRVLARTRDPILEPETEYERKGVVDNVVFPCGNVVIAGRLFVYYGAADRCVGVAACRLDELTACLLG